MSEMALTADHLIVIGRGRLIADVSVEELMASGTRKQVRVRTPEAGRLHALLAGDRVTVSSQGGDVLDVTGLDSATIGAIAARAGVALIELSPQQATLEELFMDLTRDSVEYTTPDPSVRTFEPTGTAL